MRKFSNTIEFINKSQHIHSKTYDYSETHYIRNNAKVRIRCINHGTFEQTPSSHLDSTGCPQCGREKTKQASTKYDTQKFIDCARLVHNNKYAYPDVYHGYKRKILIHCPTHGPFHQTPDTHLRGGGCNKCANDQKSSIFRMTTEQFVQRASKIHNNFYLYSNVVYVNAATKVTITCPTHGNFEQRPREHIHKRAGCPKCKNDKLPGSYSSQYFNDHPHQKTRVGYLYVIRLFVEDETILKVGITGRKTPNKRLVQYGKDNYEVIIIKNFTLYTAYLLEQQILSSLVDWSASSLYAFSGHTETLIDNEYVRNRIDEMLKEYYRLVEVDTDLQLLASFI